MDYLPAPILTNVLEEISASREHPDCCLVRRKALDILFRTIATDGAFFVMPDKNMLSALVMLKNLDKKFSDSYKAYFHQFDPLQLMQRMFNVKRLDGWKTPAATATIPRNPPTFQPCLWPDARYEHHGIERGLS